MNIATLAGQFSLDAGQAQERSPTLASFPVRDGLEENCFVLLELQPRVEPELCRQLVDILRECLGVPSRSLTARLLAGIEGCHQHLRGLRDTQEGWRVGLSCAVYHGGELWLAQAGPAFGCLFRTQETTFISTEEMAEGPVVWLGDEENPTTLLRHYPASQGDALLLASPILDKLVPREALAALQEKPPAEVLQTVYLWVREVPRGAALLARIVDHRSWNRALALGRRGLGLLRAAYVRQRRTGAKAHRVEEAPDQPKPASKKAPTRGAAPIQLGGQLFYLPRVLRLPLFIIALSLAVLLGAMLAWYVPSYQRKQSDARYAESLQRAETLSQRVSTTKDEGEARRLLAEVSGLVAQLEQEKPKDPRLLSLRQRLSQDLAKLGGVVELTDLSPLADVTPLEGGTSRLKRVVVYGSAAYLWDEGRGQLYQVEVEGRKGGPIPLLAKGDASDGKTPARPAYLTFMPATPAGGIRPEAGVLMLDQARALWEVVPGRGVRGLFLRGTQLWSEAKALAGYNGNLYLLDAAGRQVWRYLPTESGYDSEPRALLTWSEVPDLIDLALDGQIYLLSATGGLYQVVGGESKSLELKGLDKPLSQPTQLFTNATTKHLYVLDAGNRRIVVLGKDGRFVRQLWTNLVRPPQGMFVDEGKGRIYLVEGGRLYAGKLPQ